MPEPKSQLTPEKAQVKNDGQAEYLYSIVQPTTKIVKIFPFKYTAILLFLSPFDAWLSLKWAQLLWLISFTTLPSAWLCWKLSRYLKLCKWHRAQCVLILIPQAIPICRIFFSDINIAWVWAGVALIFILSLINCYFVFIKPSVEADKKPQPPTNRNKQ